MDARMSEKRKREPTETCGHKISPFKVAPTLKELNEFNYIRLRDIHLDPDCIQLIAQNIGIYKMWDYRSVRLVCKLWNQAIIDNDAYWRARVWHRPYFNCVRLLPPFRWIVKRRRWLTAMEITENGRRFTIFSAESPGEERFIYHPDTKIWLVSGHAGDVVVSFRDYPSIMLCDDKGGPLINIYQYKPGGLRLVHGFDCDGTCTDLYGNLPTQEEFLTWVDSPVRRFCDFVYRLFKQRIQDVPGHETNPIMAKRLQRYIAGCHRNFMTAVKRICHSRT